MPLVLSRSNVNAGYDGLRGREAGQSHASSGQVAQVCQQCCRAQPIWGHHQQQRSVPQQVSDNTTGDLSPFGLLWLCVEMDPYELLAGLLGHPDFFLNLTLSLSLMTLAYTQLHKPQVGSSSPKC